VSNQESCLGIIETESLAVGLEAADVMLKLKTVTILKLLFIGTGQIAILIQGKTGAVQAAIETGAKAAERKGNVLARNVIPRCDPSLISYLADFDQGGKWVEQLVQAIQKNGTT